MLSNFPILSAEQPPARIERSRIVAAAPAELPSRSLGLGPFSVEPAESGLPQLVDASGQRWGIFANQRLAEETAASLSR